MNTEAKSNYSLNDYLIRDGRYIGELVDVSLVPDRPGQVKLKFHLRIQVGLDGGKKAAKAYCDNHPYWLLRDLRSWLGEDEVAELFPNGVSVLDLKRLIGKKAVLVIVNKDRGQATPLVCVDQILPAQRRYLEAPTPEATQEPAFKWSFARKASSDDAMAA